MRVLRKLLRTAIASVTAALVLLGTSLPVFADRGGLSLWLNPVFEPGQNAIVAWNGHEEILILATDVNANSSTLLLELLPLPSNPKAVERASVDSFTRVEGIIWSRSLSLTRSIDVYGPGLSSKNIEKAVEVTFHEQIGTHNITVVKAETALALSLWINDFLRNSNVTREASIKDYQTLLEEYMTRGFLYFALDLVSVSPAAKSVEPILYYFESDFLYYPLKISTTFFGQH